MDKLEGETCPMCHEKTLTLIEDEKDIPYFGKTFIFSMQCSNCKFENMPAVTACGRCGATLQVASLPIDVNPPRASEAAKRWRRWFPTTRYWNRFRNAAADAIAASAASAATASARRCSARTAKVVVPMMPMTKAAKVAVTPPTSTRWRLVNFRTRYHVLGGRAVIGSSRR